ncbi:MAG: ECF-type sigma factor [Planctomycetota bacterium]
MSEITRLLGLVGAGSEGAEDQLLRLVHDELKRIAAAKLSSESPGHTLQTTALVNEAYIRLLGKKQSASSPTEEGSAGGDTSIQDREAIRWDSRGHFFAAAAEAMRRILIDNARRRKRQKRGGENKQVPLASADLTIDDPSDDIELVDQALSKLELENSDHAAVVKLRYFAGMTIDQTADALGVSPATVKRSWTYSRAWLKRAIMEEQLP